MKKILFLFYALLIGSAMFTSCCEEDDPDYGGTASGIYLGVIGFNQNTTIKDISLLTNYTKSNFSSFINSMTTKQGTVLYYAVESALNKLKAATFPDDLVNVSIVTFTDGLDQGSSELNSTYGGSLPAYLTAVGNRIKTDKVKNLNISAYSIGIKGNDVTDMAQFTTNLTSLASSPANAKQASSMSEVNAEFQKIAQSLYNTSSSQSLLLQIPGQGDGTKIRFTFDNVSNAATSNVYIEGTYSFATKSLTSVSYHGLSSSSGATVSGTQNGIFVSYSFVDIKLTSGGSVPTNIIKQWAYIPSTTSWQINSEFAYDPNTVTIIDRKSAAIILVLDCSSSLTASDFSNMKSYATNFITTLAANIK